MATETTKHRIPGSTLSKRIGAAAAVAASVKIAREEHAAGRSATIVTVPRTRRTNI